MIRKIKINCFFYIKDIWKNKYEREKFFFSKQKSSKKYKECAIKHCHSPASWFENPLTLNKAFTVWESSLGLFIYVRSLSLLRILHVSAITININENTKNYNVPWKSHKVDSHLKGKLLFYILNCLLISISFIF